MKRRTYAIIFTIISLLCMGIGIQNFYLRRNLRGVLYILFFWTFIPFLLCIVDLLKFIFMTDDEFDIKYNKDYLDENGIYYNTDNVVDIVEYSTVNEKSNTNDEVLLKALDYLFQIDNTLLKIKDYEFSSYVKQLNIIFKEIIDKYKECNDLDKKEILKKELDKMLDYNIPTTLKLINSYINLYDINDSNVYNLKMNINDSILSVINFLKNVENKLYQNEIIDIASDIDVLKQTLKNNGY